MQFIIAMNYLLVENLTKTYGEKTLFSDITFGLDKGQKTALIAKNGTGKTTLLRIIEGSEQADSGKIVVRNDIKISFLPQNPVFNTNLSIINAVTDFQNETSVAINEYEECINLLKNDSSEQLTKRFELASHNMDFLNAWDYETKVKEILGKLNLSDLERKTATLSGGELKKLALAKALLYNADILILDEPTNHLDIDMIEWMETQLSKSETTLLIVTHDRVFLDNVCSDIIELDNKQIFKYSGKYYYFLEKRAERLAIAEKERDKAKALYLKELEWAKRQPKARTTKSKARLDSLEIIKTKANAFNNNSEISFETKTTRLGNKILEINNISKSFGDKKIIDNFSYTFKKGERIGLVGKNGAGKTTFLRLITGILKADAGKISKGQTVLYGYYSQEGWQPKTDKRVLELIKDIAESITYGKNSITAEQFLYRFGVDYNMQATYFSKLSGGEKRKIYLLSVLIENPNFLILDEPTNDLDIFTLSALEEYLINFEGCLIIVSHDRRFLNNLVEHLFIFEGDGKIKDYYGYITDYRQIMISHNKSATKPNIKKIVLKQNKNQNKLTYKEQQELKFLEQEIKKFEKEQSEILNNMNSGKTDTKELPLLASKYEEITNILEKNTERWLELSIKLENSEK